MSNYCQAAQKHLGVGSCVCGEGSSPRAVKLLQQYWGESYVDSNGGGGEGTLYTPTKGHHSV